ncbi:MAG TPA: hypothetical protein VMV44_00630 [Rectinemataceae bacterium]|nr:hypothetical protein [Rectinemataceae bacterium]
MGELDLTLGIDSSTQGTSAVLLRRDDFTLVAETRVRYRDDPRLAGFGLAGESPILPPTEEGEAHQPAALYLAALEAVLADLPREFLARVAAIDLSAQQHGQVWLGEKGLLAMAGLRGRGAGAAGAPDLTARIAPGLAWDRAPIWMEASTAREAAGLREAMGGSEAMVAVSGSDSPLRFSGAVLAHEAARHPEAWKETRRVHLISSFLCGVLAGRPDSPVDWGNGSGTSLMNWYRRDWEGGLVSAAARLAGDGPGLFASRLPPLADPLAFSGTLAAYFVERFGMSPDCRVVVGSGDNPQSKVLASGVLLSLGTSFVLMADGERPHMSANAMYDGLGSPFMFGCRTNGALAWERLRRDHGLGPEDFAASERALAQLPPGGPPRIYQPERESFPDSPSLDLGRRSDFAADYAGVVDSSLGLLWLGSRAFAAKSASIAVTGGGASSRGVLERVAAIWRSPVLPIASVGAATGAALAAAMALIPPEERLAVLPGARARAAGAGNRIEPRADLVEAYHGSGGRLAALEKAAREAGVLGI